MIRTNPLFAALPMFVLPVLHAEEFSFVKLRESTRALAAKPYVAPTETLDDFWKNLSYDEHRQIRFDMKSGLWWGQGGRFSVDFFHPGWTAKEMVEIHEVRGNDEKKLEFDRSLFDYNESEPSASVKLPPGYAGWRARTPLNRGDYMDEFLVFLGASYFRAIPKDAPYGLSARGISINSGLPGVAEEFPAFTKFYLRQPGKDENTMKVWAVLDGPSVAGAYQFTVTPGVETVMDVEAEITLRKPVKQLGLAPFSSMFWFGEGTHPKPFDFRPEVHDSDGLLLELGSGNRHFRPLENSQKSFRHCVFALDHPRSWSLVQRDRSFASYEDTEARYHDRPSVKVEPLAGMDVGKLHLIEMPTHDETGDNIVLLWEPEKSPEIGKPFSFHYRLTWLRDLPPAPVFAVRSTRVGTPVQKPNELLIAVDFAKPLYPEKKVGDPKWDDVENFKPVVTLGQAQAKLIHAGLQDLSMANVDALPAGLGRSDQIHMPQVLRAFFVIDPQGASQLDMTCELQDEKGKAVSERWTYLWQK